MSKFRSRKLWVALGGIAVVVLNQGLGVDPGKAEAIVSAVSTIVSAYVIGQGIADSGVAKKVG